MHNDLCSSQSRVGNTNTRRDELLVPHLNPPSVTVCVLAGGGAGAIPGGAADSGGGIVVKSAWSEAFADFCNFLLFICVGVSLSKMSSILPPAAQKRIILDSGRTLENRAFLHLQLSCFYFEG